MCSFDMDFVVGFEGIAVLLEVAAVVAAAVVVVVVVVVDNIAELAVAE